MTMTSNDPFSQPPSPQAETSPKPIKPMQLPLPQFSIWTVMVFTAFVLLAASHWWTSIQLELARQEAKRAHDKMKDTRRRISQEMYYELAEVRRGFSVLNVANPSLTYVGFLPQANTNFWQWRFYIPKGKRYRLYFMLDFPYHSKRTEADWNVILEPGEGLASFRILQTPQGELEVVRTIDWIEEGSPEVPVRTVTTRKLEVPDDSWLRREWTPLEIDAASSREGNDQHVAQRQFKVNGLDGIGYLRQKSYDPRDLIALVDFMDKDGKQTEGVFIWLEPVPEESE